MDRIDRVREGARTGAAAWLAVLACGGFFASACHDDAPAPAARVRLTETKGTLHAEPLAHATEILREDFAAAPEGWNVLTDQRNVLTVDPEALTLAFRHDTERSFLTLSGKLGGYYRVLPIEPDTPYRFVGEVRARGVTPKNQPFIGATFWVGEFFAGGSPRELFAGGGHVDRLHRLPSAVGTEGWQELRTAFRSTKDSHALTLGCVLAFNEALEQGEVDFSGLRLERLSEREFWEIEARREVVEAHGLDPGVSAGDWRVRRRVGAMLGGEQRPSILALPGERLALELTVPREDPVFEVALAPWPLAFRSAAAPLVFWLRVATQELLRETVALDRPLAETAWREVDCDLSAYAGRTVTIELGIEGALPGVFGAPVVRAREGRAPGMNVLVVSIDTLRADRVGVYGASSGATPHLDALAREALVFDDMSANAPYTLPAHASLFSGQFASVHGVEDRDRRLSPQRSPILARLLAEHGYRTQAFASGGFLSPAYGFDEGFDGFSVVDPLRHVDSSYFTEFRRLFPEQSSAALTAAVGAERVRAWIEQHARESFFLFLHTYEVHDYDPPAGYVTCAAAGCTSRLTDFRPLFLNPKRRGLFPGTEEDRAHLGHLYDAALKHVDELLGGILEELQRRGIAERTIVVVTSDHGEELFERGHLQHGKTLYGEVLRIPLILLIPGETPRHVATPSMQVDLLPTLLGALGLPADERVQGVDLLRSARVARPLWCEVNDLFARKSSVLDGGWKLVHGPPDAAVGFPNEEEWELYDLVRDPGERQNRAAEDPARLRTLQALHDAFARDLQERSASLGSIDSAAEVDEALQRQLDGLGYAR